MKTLEQYFQDQPLVPEEPVSPAGRDELSPAEQAFLSKYLGITDPDSQTAAQIPSVTPQQVMAPPSSSPQPPEHLSGQSSDQSPAAPKDRAADKASDQPSSSAQDQSPPAAEQAVTRPAWSEPPAVDAAESQKALRRQDILQLIGFRLADQEYALPIDVIQEVIRAVEATKLPSAPAFLSGVINLRGKVTPLVSLRTLLRLPPDDDKFVVVCRRSGLQLGLQIQAVSTMHRVRQDRIDWNIESLLGVQNDFISGLIRTEDRRLIGILSLDHIVQTLLKT